MRHQTPPPLLKYAIRPITAKRDVIHKYIKYRNPARRRPDPGYAGHAYKFGEGRTSGFRDIAREQTHIQMYSAPLPGRNNKTVVDITYTPTRSSAAWSAHAVAY